MNEYPITPPPELVKQWIKECDQPDNPRWQEYEQDIANRAAQWGADQELEACCEWLKLEGHEYELEALLAARRPKPQSLKEMALQALAEADLGSTEAEWSQRFDTIRRALEQLND
jgi:hypothetical protein